MAGCTAVGANGTSDSGTVDAGASRAERIIADEPTASTSPSVPTTALRRVDTVELDAEALSFLDGDRVVHVGSMRQAPDVVTTLTRLLGTPKKTTTAIGDGGHCLPASTSYTWGGALRVVDLVKKTALGNDVDVRILKDSVRTKSGATIDLVGPDGVHVGEDIADRIASTSATDKESLGSTSAPAWQVVLAAGWVSSDPRAGTNGVSALTSGTTVTVIGSPMPVHAADDC
jgi:hypothetical protein